MPEIDNLESELPRKGFEAVDLRSGFVKPGGPQMDLAMRLSPEFDLTSELLRGRSKDLTKTDCAAFRDPRTGEHTSRFYNYFAKQFFGRYKNWGFAQPAKDWCLGSFKGAYDIIEGLVEMGQVSSCGEGFPQTWGVVCQWFLLGLGQSESLSLEIPALAPEAELGPASSRD